MTDLDRKARSFSDLGIRALVAAIGGTVVLGMAWYSFVSAGLLFGILAARAVYELWRIERDRVAAPPPRHLSLAAIAPIVFIAAWQEEAVLLFLLVVCALGFRRRSLLFLFYPSLVFAGYLSAIWLWDHSGPGAVLVVILATWTADIGAYFTGIRFGRRPLAPTISPKKSIEGAVGGGLLAIAVGAGVGACFGHATAGALFGVAAAIAGQAGDLAESALKRSAGVKDSGRILPGHGGVLDRFDAFVVNAAVCYLLALRVW